MGLYAAYKTSPKLETEGVYLELPYVKWRLARAGGVNQRFNAALTKIQATHGRAMQANLLPEAKLLALLYVAYAEGVILEWWAPTGVDEATGETIWSEGIETEDGSLLPVTKENIAATLHAMPDLFKDHIKPFAEGITYYRQALLDDALKNS